MAIITSGTVTNSLVGTLLTFTDTTTGYSLPIISKTLTVFDAYGNQLTNPPINMGSATVATFAISADAWYSFVMNVTDQAGTYQVTVNFLAENIYIASFLNAMVNTGCGCAPGMFCNLNKAELSISAAERFALAGSGAAADVLITSANVYVNL
jgi:hypothetical protein